MPRLYHTKSKTGCSRCRARRVKCDEGRPSCTNCSRHRVECVYDRRSVTHVQASGKNGYSGASKAVAGMQPLLSYQDQKTGIVLSDADECRERRLRELRFLHYYDIEVCPNLPDIQLENVRETWAIMMPRLAMSYEPLLNAIVAFSILYMSVTGTSDKLPIEDLPFYRAHYLEATLHEHRGMVGNMNKEIADAATLTSLILAMDAFASLHNRPLDPYEPPLAWLRMNKGVREVFAVARALLRNDSTARVSTILEDNSTMFDDEFIQNARNRAQLPHLLEPLKGDTEQDQEIYVETVSILGAILTAKENGENSGMLMRRIIIISPLLFKSRFSELVTQLKPRALVILAHYFAIAAYCGDSWLTGTMPAGEVRAIAGFLGPDWHDLLRWPLGVIGR